MRDDGSDAALVERVRRDGDVDAYAVLIDRYQATAVRLASLVTREPAEAEDVAQEAFIKAFYALDRFRPGASFRPWLLRIVANEARNSRSATQRRTTLHARFAETEVLAGHGHSTEEAVVADEQRTAVLLALDELRDDDRAVLAYRYLFDMSESEMAQALGCAPGTVKSRLSRSLTRLRESLARMAPLVIVPVPLEAWLAHTLPDVAAATHPAAHGELVIAVLKHLAAPTAVGVSGAAATARPPDTAAGDHRQRGGWVCDRIGGSRRTVVVDGVAARDAFPAQPSCRNSHHSWCHAHSTRSWQRYGGVRC